LKDKKVPLNYRLFENDALIFKTLQSKEIAILENNKPFLKIAFEDFENLGIWTKVNAPFICLEPWLGYSDTIYSKGMISEKEGIQFVKENAKYECQFSIEIL
jgi:galactose mutarotase-like enzyme